MSALLFTAQRAFLARLCSSVDVAPPLESHVAAFVSEVGSVGDRRLGCGLARVLREAPNLKVDRMTVDET